MDINHFILRNVLVPLLVRAHKIILQTPLMPSYRYVTHEFNKPWREIVFILSRAAAEHRRTKW